MGGGGALAGRVALVTGASRGIGAAIAEGFGAAGATVVLCARNEAQLSLVARRVQAAGGGVLVAHGDLSRPADVERIAHEVLRAFRRVDVLCNNAAAFHQGLLREQDPALLLDELHANVWAPFILTRALLPSMVANEYGRIINVTSELATRPVLPFGAHGISKAAFNQLTRYLALELDRTNILVNGYDPGIVRTAMNPTATALPDVTVAAALRLATLPDDGPSGHFFDRQGNELPW